ncbi:MAG: glycosyltransferase family 1 protein [Gaiellaceae bacterium]
MRVGISLLTLSPGISGGSETYARGLTRALAAAGSLEYTALVPGRAPDAAGGLPRAVVDEPAWAGRGPSRIPALALASRRSRDLRASLRALDVVHYALTVPIPRASVPSVVTLHDLQHLDLPELFGRGQRWFRRLAYDRTTRSATAVVVPSAFVRSRAVERLGIDPARLHVIPHAVAHDLFHPSDEPRERFVLYPARAWPHKNHRTLLDAFALLRDSHPELTLVLTGEGLEALEPLPSGVERRGVVTLEELAALYRRAACLVYPSLYEGFGLPPLEAMASGCPVAAANVGAIPEVCGDAAVLFDPTDPEAIAEAVLEADGRRAELRDRGLGRAGAFTWEKLASAHDSVYASTHRNGEVP